jgi:hypothetical protein
MYLPENASKARVKEAENARKNRAEIVTAFSQGQVSRRDLINWGLISAGGLLVPTSGLSVFAKSAYAKTTIPTGAPRSPLMGAKDFSQPMPRFELFERYPVSDCDPLPTCEANTSLANPLTGRGPCEGRPPGLEWGHQRWEEFYPQVAVQTTQMPARINTSTVNPGVRPTFHPILPDQRPEKLWTFEGTIPPKLLIGRYGDPVLFRHCNGLPRDPAFNGGFGRHTITTHNHNGHNPGESDGFTGAFFFPGQFYDYHWPIVLAGHDTINRDAMDWRAGGPDDGDGIIRVLGDWRETMSTHWFHDHMLDFTAQNVYKSNAAMFKIYSALDRGREDPTTG